MNYKPDESALMAYLYGEVEGPEKEKIEQYLLQNPEARKDLEKFKALRSIMGSVKDKEVIAPPIFIDQPKQNVFRNSPYLKTVMSIAASLLLIMIVGKITDTKVHYSDHELKISFGETNKPNPAETHPVAMLTTNQVQQMINASLNENDSSMQNRWKDSQQELDASIKKNLLKNSDRLDHLVHEASTASQQQIQGYVAGLQNENMNLVKDYFQLTSTDQKKYIEDLLIDFAKYMKQQQNNDLQVVQTRLNNLEKNTDIFKQETEHILSSIITNRNNSTTKGINN